MKRLFLPPILIVIAIISTSSGPNIKSEVDSKEISYYVSSFKKSEALSLRVNRIKLVKILNREASKKKIRPDFIIKTSNTKQAIKGFGGSFNEQGWAALSVLNAGERQKVINNIFSSGEANFSYGRIPIGSSDYALSRYTLAPEKDDFSMKHFNLDRDKQYLIPYIKEAQAIRPDIFLWGSAWSPPIWMKDNNDYEAGKFIDDPKYYRAYALYLAKFAEEYGKEGMPISLLAVQNEPTIVTGYPNGGWTPEQFRIFIRDYCGPLFVQRGLSTGIMLGTLNEGNYNTFAKTVLDDPEAKKYVKMVGLQWDGDNQIPDLLRNHPDIPIMQTETDCGNWHWRKGFNSRKAPNDFKYAHYTWMRIRDYLASGAESYLLWNIVLDQEGMNIDKKRRWPQNSGIVIDTNTKKVSYTPMFRAFEHFTRYLPSGSLYIEPELKYFGAVAFKAPDGSIVVEITNNMGSDNVVIGEIDGKLYEIVIPPTSFSTLVMNK